MVEINLRRKKIWASVLDIECRALSIAWYLEFTKLCSVNFTQISKNLFAMFCFCKPRNGKKILQSYYGTLKLTTWMHSFL